MTLDRFTRAKELIEANFKKGDHVGIVKLTALIMKNIGSDDRTVSGYLKTMLNTGLMKDINHAHFEIR